MDISYILFNSLVYGIVAFVMMSFFAYIKVLNFALWIVMILLAYIIQIIYSQWINSITITLLIGTIIIYLFINWLILKYFKNTKKRELFGLVFTLGASILLENLVNYIFGPNAVSIWGFSLNNTMMLIGFVLINMWVFYFIKRSFLGKIFKGIFENVNVIKSLGFKTNKNLQIFSLFLLLLLWVTAWMLLINWNVRASDALFYLIKGIWIMILVGITKIEYVFVGTLLYVLLEYVLFIKLWLPIAYKETLVLIIMLLVLMIKPQGLFTRKITRKS